MTKIECPVALQRDKSPREILEGITDPTTEADKIRYDLGEGDRLHRAECGMGQCGVKAIVSLTEGGRVASTDIIDPQSCANQEPPQRTSTQITYHATQ